VKAISQVAILVRDYDEALRFYVGVLGFELLEDTQVSVQKRWVRVRPKGDGPALLLARAVGAEQLARVGDQAGGRVFVFLDTDDLRRDYAELSARGVEFVRPPTEAPFGRAAVFRDLYGNLFDLVQRSV
jgi:catechol 2,3-dioxygenase-like lactoylglutathione lyase family enzyme